MSVTNLLDELLGTAAAANDLSGPFEAIADDFLDVSAEHIDTAGGSGGTPWEPLSRRTLDERQRRGLGVQPLVYASSRGGRILAALSERGAPWQVRDIGSHELRVGTDLGIAGAHHRGRGAIPRRPLIAIPTDVEERWIGALASHLAPESASSGRFGL